MARRRAREASFDWSWAKLLLEESTLQDSALVLNETSARYLTHNAPPAVCVFLPGHQHRSWQRELSRVYDSVKSYCVISAERPRVIVPLADLSWIRAGLQMHRPGRFAARILLTFARHLVGLGFRQHLMGRVLVIGSGLKDPSKPPQPSGASVGRDYAMYVGTDGPKQKFVLLPLQRGSDPSVIIKVARSHAARTALASEYEALTALATTAISSSVPKVYSFSNSNCEARLVQEFRAKAESEVLFRSSSTQKVLSFLRALERQNVCYVALSGLLQKIARSQTAPPDDILAGPKWGRLIRLAEDGQRVRLNRVHGDFAKWNLIATDDELFVYDWEDSDSNGLRLSDAFYFILSEYVHVRKSSGMRSARQARSDALDFAAMMFERVSSEVDVSMYLDIWLISRAYEHSFFKQVLIADV